MKKIAKIDYFFTKRPLPGNKDSKCGDTGIIKKFNNKVFIAIADVLGHGKKAYKVAITLDKYLEKNYRRDLIEIIKGIHVCLKESRGAAVGLCLLDLKTGQLKYVGIGNIVARKFGSSNVRIISRSGVVGYVIPAPREETMKLYDGDILVFYTDGVKEHFELEDYPELLRDDAKTIATHIIHQFGKEEDDAACMALRYWGGLNHQND